MGVRMWPVVLTFVLFVLPFVMVLGGVVFSNMLVPRERTRRVS